MRRVPCTKPAWLAAGVAIVIAIVAAGASWGATGRAGAAARATPRVRTAVTHGVPKLIWGPITLPNGASAFPVYHQLGVSVFEMDLNWALAAPTRPQHPTDPDDSAYAWPTDVDAALRAAARYHIGVCLLVQRTPGWANGGRSSVWAPDHASDYGDFLTAAARRYPGVHLWMIWGEPNRDQVSDFEPMPPHSPVGPRRYALLLDSAYHALKALSPRNTVIGGDTWSFGVVEPADFLRWMRLPNGKPPPLDLYGHNPFSRRFPHLASSPYFPGGRDINDIDSLHAQLVHTYHRNVKLWLSEFTISSDHNNVAFDFHVSRAAQARWVTAAYALVNSTDYVAGLGWFNLADDPPGSPERLSQGLMTWDLHRKPAFYAYQRAR